MLVLDNGFIVKVKVFLRDCSVSSLKVVPLHNAFLKL